MFNLSTKILTTKDNPVDGSMYFNMMSSIIKYSVNYFYPITICITV